VIMSAVHPISATPSSSFARTTPNGRFCARHSLTISLYRGSKMCKGKGTPGSKTKSRGNRGSSVLTKSLRFGVAPAGRVVRLYAVLDLPLPED